MQNEDLRQTIMKLLYNAPCRPEMEGEPGSCPYRRHGLCREINKLDICAMGLLADLLIANGMLQKWIPASEPPEEHDSVWAKLYGTKSWQPGLFRKCSYDVLACVEKKDGRRRVISIRTHDGKWDITKLNEETVICWRPKPP